MAYSHRSKTVSAVAAALAVVIPTHVSALPSNAVAETRMEHISIVATGTGSPVILIPGLASPRAVWEAMVPDLATKHRVYLVQVNGFGGDDPGANLKPGILDGVVADIDRLIVREKLGQTAIVGHSMGGLVGLMFAKAHPEHVGKLMIVDALPFYGTLFSPTATPALVQPQAAAMRDQMVASYGKPDTGGAKAVPAKLALKPDSQAKVAVWATVADKRVVGKAVYEDLQTDLRPDMAQIFTPITLLYPWNDAGPSKLMAEALYHGAYAAAPHVSFVDIADAGHFVMLDQPAAFARALDAFLAN